MKNTFYNILYSLFCIICLIYLIIISSNFAIIISLTFALVSFGTEYIKLNLLIRKIYLSNHKIAETLPKALIDVCNKKARIIIYSLKNLFNIEVNVAGAAVLSFRKKPLFIIDPKLLKYYEKKPEAAIAILEHENYHIIQRHYFFQNLNSFYILTINTISIVYYTLNAYSNFRLVFYYIFFISILLLDLLKTKYKNILYLPLIAYAFYYKITFIPLILILIVIILFNQIKQKNELDADVYALSKIGNKSDLLEIFTRNYKSPNPIVERLFGTHPSNKRRRANILKDH